MTTGTSKGDFEITEQWALTLICSYSYTRWSKLEQTDAPIIILRHLTSLFYDKNRSSISQRMLVGLLWGLDAESYLRFESSERCLCCTLSRCTPAGCPRSSSPQQPRGCGSPTGQPQYRAEPAAGTWGKTAWDPSSPRDSKTDTTGVCAFM